jgi:hypothetical protein
MPEAPEAKSRITARVVLFSFLVTFVMARILVYCIMARDIPDLFLHVGGTHLHHLNYGIFLLSAVGAYLLFLQPAGRRRRFAAAVYGAGLALTFDEFGMWLHLGGSYWQRASFDAVTVVGSGLALLAYAPRFTSFRQRHILSAAFSLVLVAIFFGLWSRASHYAERSLAPRLELLEQQGPR